MNEGKLGSTAAPPQREEGTCVMATEKSDGRAVREAASNLKVARSIPGCAK